MRFFSSLITGALLAGCGGVAGVATGTPPSVTPVETPGPTATGAAVGATATPVGNDNITVAKPSAKQEVRSPVTVEGRARVFEATVQVQVKDASGKPLASEFTTASKGAPEWGDYRVEVAYRVAARQEGVVEVYAPSAKDGSPQFLVAVPVVLLPN